MSTTMEFKVHFQGGHRGRKQLHSGVKPPPATAVDGRVPRVARLMALAVRFEQLVQSGTVRDYAEIARLGHVSRARVGQIINALMLAPDIQETLLNLAPVIEGRDPIAERHVRRIASTPDWSRQRLMFERIMPR